MDLSPGYVENVQSIAVSVGQLLVRELMDGFCQSPIEAMFCAALFQTLDLRGDVRAYIHKEGRPGARRADPYIYVKPQAQIGRYRVDFLVGTSWGLVEAIVECDGREFHHSTREQIERDRNRDKDLEAADYRVFRFPGTEIYNAPFSAANAVYRWLLEKNGQPPEWEPTNG